MPRANLTKEQLIKFMDESMKRSLERFREEDHQRLMARFRAERKAEEERLFAKVERRNLEHQEFTEYEVFHPVTYRRKFIKTRDEALEYYKKDWIVIEHHVTLCRPSMFNGTRVDVSMTWNDNPEFNPEN
jgi:hypothetical protein